MKTFIYILKVLYKKKWMLLIIPLLVAIIVYIFLSTQPSKYKSSTTVYTGIISGYDAYSANSSVQDWMAVNNAIDNLINIIHAESTLETVFLRLIARNLVHCDPKSDNEFLSASSSAELLSITPYEVLYLVVPGDENATYRNLRQYYDKDNANFLKQLFNWEHHLYSFKALSTVDVTRMSNSDMLKISYTNDDRFIVYNTLLLIEEEFINQYVQIRFEQTNDVVAYFEHELEIIGAELRAKEDRLTNYNVTNSIINYQEQTRMVAERSRDIDEVTETVTREYEGAKQKVSTLEEKMGMAAEVYQSNAEFVRQINKLTSLYSESSVKKQEGESTDEVSKQISKETDKLKNVSTELAAHHYTKEGIASETIVAEWLTALLDKVRSEQELKVLQQSKRDIDNEFKRFSPVGSSIKRQDREINFSEQSYLSNLQGLNEAKLRQKNLQLTSATFRTITPPTVAVKAEKTKNTLYAIITFILVLVVLIVFIIIVELFNRVPYDQQAARKIIGLPILGAFPLLNDMSDDSIPSRTLAINQLGNACINYFDRKKDVNIINVVSVYSDDGKTSLCEALMQHFERIGTKPELITYEKDFQVENKYYLMAGSIYDFGMNENNFDTLPEANVIIVEYPPLSTVSFPVKLLESASLTILVANASKPWSDMSSIILRQLKMNDREHKIAAILNRADEDCVGTFTGMLPPYTLRHKIHYTMWNLGNVTFDDNRG